MDNSGARSTGSARLTANLNLSSPLSLGDLFNANAMHTQGSDYLQLKWTLPVADDGWRIGAYLSNLSYKLVTAEFAALNGHGSSDNLGAEASYPLLRSRLKNLYLNLNYDHKGFDNQSAGVTQSHYQTESGAIYLSGNLYDSMGLGGVYSASVALITGHMALGEINSGENATHNGNFGKFRYGFSRQQVISDNISVYAGVSGQNANKRLDSSEKFYLGGSNGVRAYPGSEGGGSSANLFNLELRDSLPYGFNLTGFFDMGHVINYDGSPSYTLKGSGAALAWQTSSGLNLKTTWARRIGSNPNPTANGNDQDGTLIKNRFWLTINQQI